MRGADPSWEIMPVANPDLAQGKRRRMIRDSLAKDPVGTARPAYQARHRQQIVPPFCLDRACRQLLLRAQVATDSVLDPTLQQVELPDLVTEPTLRRHEWEIAFHDTVQDVGLAAAELELPERGIR